MLGDFQRALSRLRTDTPKGLVIMGATLGADAEAQFEKALSACRSAGTSVVFVLSKHQKDLISKISNTDHSRILFDHPVTLRSIRQALEEMLNR